MCRSERDEPELAAAPREGCWCSTASRCSSTRSPTGRRTCTSLPLRARSPASNFSIATAATVRQQVGPRRLTSGSSGRRWRAAAEPQACVPSMVTDLEVRVLRGPGHGDSSEAQGAGREVDAEGSVERIHGLTNRNRIRGVHGRASGHGTAKLSRPGPVSVNPAVVRRRPVTLPGEISPRARKGDAARAVEQEVSRGCSHRTAVRCRAE